MVPGQSACLQSMSRMTTMKGFIILAIIATEKIVKELNFGKLTLQNCSVRKGFDFRNS